MSDTLVIEDQVVLITPEQKHRKSDQAPFMLYKIETLKGLTLETFKREVAESAHKTIGYPSLLTIKTEKNGEYVNRYLQMAVIKPTEGYVGTAMAGAMQAHAQALPPNADSFTTYTPGGGSITSGNGLTQTRPEGPTQKDVTIWRQTATKVAAHLSKTADEFWPNVALLLKFYETGQPPTYPGAPQATQEGYMKAPDATSNLPHIPQPTWPEASPTPVIPDYGIAGDPGDGIPFR